MWRRRRVADKEQCPQCPALMMNVNIQIATTKKMYGMFEKAERKHIADTTPGWRWCLAPGCNAGQVHESKNIRQEAPKSKSRSKKKVVDPETDVDNICTCNDCGARACATCDRPFHEVCSNLGPRQSLRASLQCDLPRAMTFTH